MVLTPVLSTMFPHVSLSRRNSNSELSRFGTDTRLQRCAQLPLDHFEWGYGLYARGKDECCSSVFLVGSPPFGSATMNKHLPEIRTEHEPGILVYFRHTGETTFDQLIELREAFQAVIEFDIECIPGSRFANP